MQGRAQVSVPFGRSWVRAPKWYVFAHYWPTQNRRATRNQSWISTRCLNNLDTAFALETFVIPRVPPLVSDVITPSCQGHMSLSQRARPIGQSPPPPYESLGSGSHDHLQHFANRR